MTPRLALPRITTKWDRYRTDILIATEGKALQGIESNNWLWPHDSYSGWK
jgi:hypothetical protein